MTIFNLFILILCVNLSTTADQLADISANSRTLVHTHILLRHGDRTPWALIPSDTENGIDSWPEGVGKVTRLGIEQGYYLGQLIKRRYANFMPAEYSGKDLYVRSSDRSRTLVTAQAVLAGMYPRMGVNFIDQLNPIPIHTIPWDQDKMLNVFIRCPTAEQELDNVYNSRKYKKLERKYADLLLLMGQKSGIGPVPLPFKDVTRVYDPLYVESLHPEKHKLPLWVNRAIMLEMSQAYEQSYYSLYDSDKLKRLRCGPPISEILERIQQKISSKSSELSTQKMYAYSAHDTNIEAVLVGFGIKPDFFPPYASALMIELHKDLNDNSHHLRLFYRNDTQKDDIYELEIPDCQQPCSFEQINQKMQETLIPKNWEVECKLISSDANSFSYSLTIIFLCWSVLQFL